MVDVASDVKVIENDIAHITIELDRHDQRITRLERSDKVMLAAVSLAASIFAALGAFGAAWLLK